MGRKEYCIFLALSAVGIPPATETMQKYRLPSNNSPFLPLGRHLFIIFASTESSAPCVTCCYCCAL